MATQTMNVENVEAAYPLSLASEELADPREER